jgi:hypothetical protein
MKHALVAAAAAVGLLAAAPASAQSTSVTTSTMTTGATGSITIAPEKRTVIKQRLSTAKPVTIKEKVTVGAMVPADVELQTVPETVVSDVPAVKGYRYFVWNDEVVLVDPSSRKVVQIIE